MKRLFFLLLLAFGATTMSFAQFYTVSVGTFLNAKTQDFDNIRHLGLVYSNPMDANLSQVFVGGFDNMAKAEEVVKVLRKKGYTSAHTQERRLEDGESVIVVQMATRYINKTIEWEKFSAAGPLYVLLTDNKVKVLTGVFPSLDAAKNQLPAIRKTGYKDAFIKKVNSALLVDITEFETGIKKPLIDLAVDDLPDTPIITEEEEIPAEYDTPSTPGLVTPKSGTPVSYETPVNPSYSKPLFEPLAESNTNIPEIRVRIKRRSALELQKALKAGGYYTSSLDGYYGKGTTAGYEKAMATNPTLIKYKAIAAYDKPAVSTASNDRLQYAIDNLPKETEASTKVIEGSTQAVAKAYQAYLLFRQLGPSNDVNALMNTAIREAYVGKKMVNKPPFDYNATYAYQDLNQLVLHLYYIHAAPGNIYAIPCWMNRYHPQETANAQAAIAGFGDSDFKMEACDQFLAWPEIKMLNAIARDLHTGAPVSDSELATSASRRASLFIGAKPLNGEQTTAIETWNQELWTNLMSWGNRDPYHEQAITGLKIAYYQSQVRLEDYFMNQGHSAGEAKGLSLLTLNTLVDHYLKRFS